MVYNKQGVIIFGIRNNTVLIDFLNDSILVGATDLESLCRALHDNPVTPVYVRPIICIKLRCVIVFDQRLSSIDTSHYVH